MVIESNINMFKLKGLPKGGKKVRGWRKKENGTTSTQYPTQAGFEWACTAGFRPMGFCAEVNSEGTNCLCYWRRRPTTSHSECSCSRLGLGSCRGLLLWMLLCSSHLSIGPQPYPQSALAFIYKTIWATRRGTVNSTPSLFPCNDRRWCSSFF